MADSASRRSQVSQIGWYDQAEPANFAFPVEVSPSAVIGLCLVRLGFMASRFGVVALGSTSLVGYALSCATLRVAIITTRSVVQLSLDDAQAAKNKRLVES